MSWWLSNTGQVEQRAANPGGWLGPYQTQTAARAALSSADGSGGLGRQGKHARGAPTGTQLADLLETAIGTPYAWGGTNPFGGGADCSGLIYWGLGKLGMRSMPRTSQQMYSWAQPVGASQLQPGDLIFFEGNPPAHVAVYMGGDKIIQDSTYGVPVAVTGWQPGTGGEVGYGRVPGLHYAGEAGVTPVQQGTTVQTTSAVSAVGSAVSATGTLLSGAADIVDHVFAFFRPGQGWRLAFGAGGGLALAAAVRQWRSVAETPDAGPGFPAAIFLSGAAVLGLFIALRPWPAGETPVGYAADVITGQAPPAGPPLPSEHDAIEAGLAVILGAWLLSKVSAAAGGLGGIIDTILGALGLKALGGGGGEVPPPVEVPPVEVPPVLA